MIAPPCSHSGIASLGRRAAALLLLGAALAAPALDPERLITQYQQDHWQTEQGLPQNGVQTLARTPDGYLWIGTEEGLARFDGIRFTVFDLAHYPALGHNLVATLLADREGRLWIGTRAGLVRREGERFIPYGPESGLPKFTVSSLLEDHAGRLWVGLLGGGLYRLDGKRFTAVLPPGGAFPGKRIRALLEEAGGIVWAASEAGLARIDERGVTALTTTAGLTDDNCFALAQGPDRRLWAGCEHGLNRREGARWQRFTMHDGLSSGRIRALTHDAAGNLWIATEDGGLNRFAKERFSALTTANGLSGDSVDALLADVEGNLWVGGSSSGLTRLKDSLFIVFTEKEGLAGDLVFTVTESRDGALWTGSRSRGMNRYRDGRFTRFTTRDGLSSNEVSVIAEDAAGMLWIGTYGGGLDAYRGGKFSALRRSDGLLSDDISALLAARDGSLWIGTGGGGVNHLVDGKLTGITEREGLPDGNIMALHEDETGALWIGGSQGLSRLQEGRITAWTAKDGLPTAGIAAIAEAPAGTLWLGTAGGGLVRFKDGRFSRLTMRDGLPNDSILAFLIDGRGALWMSSNRGILRATPDELSAALDGNTPKPAFTLYGVADGMKSAECYGGSQPSAWRSRDGKLWFSTIRGLVMADPARPAPPSRPPPVAIESAMLGGAPLPLAGALRLPAGTHALEINYTALNLRDPGRIRFRYRLEGYDADWIEAGPRRTAYYPRLPGGDYRFVVAAEAGAGGGRGEASLPLTVAPAPLERTSVRLLLLALLALAGWGFHRLRVWRLKRRQRELERQVGERTESLRVANRELERLATLDGLTRIANRRAFDEALARAWPDHRRRGAPLALVLCDIDHFKTYNDSCGHPAGDKALQAVAGALAAGCRRSTDLAARYGGEEFVLLLCDTAAVTAAEVAADELAAVRALRIAHPASSAADHVTLSLGVAALVPDGGNSPEALLKAADEALYAAKHQGRNRVVVSGVARGGDPPSVAGAGPSKTLM